MEVGARAGGRPKAASLPPGLRIVDAAVDILREEAHRIRHAEVDDLAVDHRHQRLAAVRLRDRHVLTEAEGVEAVDPQVVRMVRAALLVHALELRPGHAIERPAFGTELAARRLGPADLSLALAAIE